MLQMNLITRKELWGGLYLELAWEVHGGVRGELYEEVRGKLYGRSLRELWRLGTQIRTDFSHSKISRV